MKVLVGNFLKKESSSGIILIFVTIIALIFSNTFLSDFYNTFLQTQIEFKVGSSFEISKPLILWVNDGLMAIFFFLIGLELKRELLIGEINTFKKATFPLVAALGGVLIPVLLYLVLNQDPNTTKAWGIPMATDIAFALAILGTLGKRVPLSLKIFLTAFAIIDDIAAVLVIAIFYSAAINWVLVLIALALIGFLALIYYKFNYSLAVGLIIATIVWFLFLKSGIHPTIAGVLLAFTVPIKRRINIFSFSKNLSILSNKIAQNAAGEENNNKHLLSEDEINNIDNLDDLKFKVCSPLQFLEHKLHSFTAYLILPIFAFANAGVVISTSYNFNFSLMSNIAISLFFGKLLGITLFCYLGLKLKVTQLPSGVNFKQIIGIASIAGVGFTMSIFIDNLAFAGDLISINSAKVGILIGSFTSGLLGFLILRFSSKADKL